MALSSPIEKQSEHIQYALDSLTQLFQEMKDHHPCFNFRGKFEDRFTNAILDIANTAMEAQKHSVMVNRKLSFLLIECFQNVVRHGQKTAVTVTQKDEGMFGFRNLEDAFVINSINFIEKNDKVGLRSQVEEINALDSAGLRSLYKKNLHNNDLSAKGGAGLGLIELARKSGNQLLYQFEDSINNYTLFHQQITFLHTDAKEVVKENMAEQAQLYRKMERENLHLLYKGDFSQKSIVPLLAILQQSLGEGAVSDATARKAGHVLIECIQNVSKHGVAGGPEARQGMIAIGQKDGKLFLQCANIINSSERTFLTEKLQFLQILDKEELKAMHKTAIKASLRFENKQKSGLGLIEIARACSEPIAFKFDRWSDDQYLFALHAII
jgi:anti-sigma regulatory factor (Ser/Thr protein kinase)